MIYLDNAATSHPKPPEVLAAMARYLETGGNPGRSGHRLARASEDLIWDAREALSEFLGVDQPERITFAYNATTALNIAIKGLVSTGDRVLTSAFEHNSVVRPLYALREAEVTTSTIPPAPNAPVDLDWLEAELRDPRVRLVIVSHVSNVTGAVAPVGAIHELTRRAEVPLVVDAAQSVGHVPISGDDADVLVFSGHKGLYGPQGVGGMYVSERAPVRPLMQGGTGGRSELPQQPRWLPYALECGTPNGVGIAGLAAGLRYVVKRGAEVIRAHETALREELTGRLRGIQGVRLHEWPGAEPPGPVVSVTFDGVAPGTAAELLEERHGVLVRAGLHCAPLAHRTLETIGTGTVRFSMSHLTSWSELDNLTGAVTEIAKVSEVR
jgi:cysteine desulfurase family protein